MSEQHSSEKKWSEMKRTIYIASASLLVFGLAVLLAKPSLAQEITGEGNERMYERTYRMNLTGHDTIHFEDMGSEMEIKTTSGNELLIWQSIPVKDRSRSEAMSFGREFELELSVRNGRAEVESPGEPRGSMYEIRVPEGIHVDLGTEWGTVEVSGLGGNLEIRHGGGAIEVDDIAGFVTIVTEGGTVEVNDVAGALTIQSDGGGVSAERIGDDVTLAIGGGGIEIENVQGDVTATTAGGNVDISVVTGDVTAVTSAGNMDVEDVGGSADLSNGGGSIDVSRVEGSLTATTSGGDIDAMDVGGRIRVETLAGDVDLTDVRSSLRVISEVGDVDVEVSHADFLEEGSIEIDLGYGDIDLMLPRKTDALLIANVQESGGIEIDNEHWDVEVLRTRGQTEQGRSRRAEIQIGRGGGEISIRLLSGEITIEHQ